MKRLFVVGMLTALVVLHMGPTVPGGGVPACQAAEKDWKAEFDAVCGQTDNAMNMSADELKKALERCAALQSVIEGLEATPRKIYLKRLQMCRNLFSYMLDNRLKSEQK